METRNGETRGFAKDRPIVIIPCGKEKTHTADVVAAALYRGEYFNACLRYGLTLTTANNVLILSAKHGLLGLTDVVAYYNVKMGEGSSISWIEILRQAIRLELSERTDVILLVGGNYLVACKKIWPKANTPFTGIGTIGKQLQWLKHNTKETGDE